MEEALISVIVPVYNIEVYLPRCLDCLTNQTYRNLEIILVDDGSTDRSGRLCDEYAKKDSRVRVIHQENRGLWAARNAGQDVSTGAFLMFPDGDDYFHKDIIKLLYESINLSPEYDIAIAKEEKTYDINGDITCEVKPILTTKDQNELITGLLSSGDDTFFVYMWNKLYRRNLIHDIRSNDYVRSQDFDVNLRIFLKTRKAVLINNVLYYWYQHQGSLTKQANSRELMHQSRSRCLFMNLSNLSCEQRQYRPLLLRKMFKAIAAWNAYVFGTKDYYSVRKECKRYLKAYVNEYMSCRQVPFQERMGCLLFILSPRIMRIWMKASHNM